MGVAAVLVSITRRQATQNTQKRAPDPPDARFERLDYRTSMIMPAPTVPFVASSTRMNPPVSRLRE